MTGEHPRVIDAERPSPGVHPAAASRVHLAPVTALLRSRRGLWAFAAIVFVATVVQVLRNPLSAVWSTDVQWTHPLPLGVATVIAVAVCAAQSASLALSPRAPRLTVAFTLLGYVTLIALGLPAWAQPTQFTVAVALFLLGAQLPARSAVVTFAAAGALALTVLLAWANSTGATLATASLFAFDQGASFLLPASAATALGIWWRVISQRAAQTQAEADRAARQHDQRVEAARVQERARIAQELHDVAGQHIAGLLSLADAAIEVEIDGLDRARALIEDMRTEGRFASASILAALRDLRAVDAPQAPRTPDLHRAGDLVEFWRRRGMTIDCTVTGDVSDLPAMISTSAYRGIQESLTNAARHAPGAPVRLRLAVDDERLRIEVSNPPAPGGRAAPERIGLGWGLDGLRTRAQLLNGSVSAGPCPDGGWSVAIEIPLPEGETPT